ncbi:MAG: 50S ribosomal protein L2 [Promethearchaeia archaeon]
MGKRILAQRKGQGNLWSRSPAHRHLGRVKYRSFKENEKEFTFEVIDLLHSPGRGAPVAKIRYEDGVKDLWLPPEGIFVGDKFTQSLINVDIKVGNVLPIREVPIGVLIYNIEARPGDGGKFARSSGVSAIINEKQKDGKVQVIFRSKKRKWFNPKCLCTIGVVAGGGRTDKPFLKAGAKYHHLKPKGKKWPIVRGCTMNAVAHPHGGGQKQSSHKSTTVGRNTPPGRKVGQISARRTGHKN